MFRWKIQDRAAFGADGHSLARGRSRRDDGAPNYRFDTQQQQPERPTRKPAQSSDLEQYALAKLRLPQAHALAKGDKVLIAVIDSSIDTAHPELAGMVVDSYDALKTDEKPHSHGTAIAGAIVAHAKLMGVAPHARILGVDRVQRHRQQRRGTTFASSRASTGRSRMARASSI